MNPNSKGVRLLNVSNDRLNEREKDSQKEKERGREGEIEREGYSEGGRDRERGIQ